MCVGKFAVEFADTINSFVHASAHVRVRMSWPNLILMLSTFSIAVLRHNRFVFMARLWNYTNYCARLWNYCKVIGRCERAVQLLRWTLANVVKLVVFTSPWLAVWLLKCRDIMLVAWDHMVQTVVHIYIHMQCHVSTISPSWRSKHSQVWYVHVCGKPSTCNVYPVLSLVLFNLVEVSK